MLASASCFLRAPHRELLKSNGVFDRDNSAFQPKLCLGVCTSRTTSSWNNRNHDHETFCVVVPVTGVMVLPPRRWISARWQWMKSSGRRIWQQHSERGSTRTYRLRAQSRLLVSQRDDGVDVGRTARGDIACNDCDHQEQRGGKGERERIAKLHFEQQRAQIAG